MIIPAYEYASKYDTWADEELAFTQKRVFKTTGGKPYNNTHYDEYNEILLSVVREVFNIFKAVAIAKKKISTKTK